MSNEIIRISNIARQHRKANNKTRIYVDIVKMGYAM